MPGTAPGSNATAGRRARGAWIAAVLPLACVLGAPASAFGQRGAGFVEQSPSPETPTDGFPGLFDTNLAAPGKAAVSLPWLSLSIGVTENLTVGTNPLPLLAWIGGRPGGMLSARYRMNSSAGSRTVLDALGGGFAVALGADRLSTGFLALGSNTTLFLGSHHLLLLHAMGGVLHVSQTSRDGSYDRTVVAGLLAGASYMAIATSWLSFQVSVLPIPLASVTQDGTFRASELDVALGRVLSRTLYQARASFRLGEMWLLEVGAVGMGKMIPLPWLNAAITF